jgi:hypothetical protein
LFLTVSKAPAWHIVGTQKLDPMNEYVNTSFATQARIFQHLGLGDGNRVDKWDTEE